MKHVFLSMILGSMLALTSCAHSSGKGGEGKTECGCKKSCCESGCTDGSCDMKKPEAASAPKAK